MNYLDIAKTNALTGWRANVLGVVGAFVTLLISKGVIVPEHMQDVWVALPAFLVGLVTRFAPAAPSK